MAEAGTPLTFVDVFAGAGGFTLGFVRAGFECVGAVENDTVASRTYATNFPDHASLPLTKLGPAEGDVRQFHQRTIDGSLAALGCDEIDVLLGGPPCQGFSRVGRGKLDSLASSKGAFRRDKRNALYKDFLRVLSWLRPRAFLVENVPGMLEMGDGNLAEAICGLAASAGYEAVYTILNAAWYGVPQTRSRVFILGVRDDLSVTPSFPAPFFRLTDADGSPGSGESPSGAPRSPCFIHTSNPPEGRKARTTEEALGDLPPFFEHLMNPKYRAYRGAIQPRPYRPGRPNGFAALMRRWDDSSVSRVVSDHFCRCTPRDYEIFARMRPGDTYPRAVKIAEELFEQALRRHCQDGTVPRKADYVPPYNPETFHEKWKKLIPDRPSWTITAHLAKDCYSHIHYDSAQKRSITIREAARLQSFPDAFAFAGNVGDCFRQIGNAVPPLLAFELARHLRVLLGNLRGCSRTQLGDNCCPSSGPADGACEGSGGAIGSLGRQGGGPHG